MEPVNVSDTLFKTKFLNSGGIIDNLNPVSARTFPWMDGLINLFCKVRRMRKNAVFVGIFANYVPSYDARSIFN